MEERQNSAEVINSYFGSSFKKEDLNLNTLLRLVWRIQEEGFVVNIQDLTRDLGSEPDFRIWFNREEDMLECMFGQISQGYASSVTEDGSLEQCLAYSIAQWCKYSKYYTSGITWKRIRSHSPVKWEGTLELPGNSPILLYRIHDLDYYNLEYKESPDAAIMLEFDTSSMSMDEIKLHAEHRMYSNIAKIEEFGLNLCLSTY